MLTLKLQTIPDDKVMGIYKGKLPERMRYLHPDAAQSFLVGDDRLGGLVNGVVVSDMFRSPESSLAAVRAGRGAKAPGFSGHNFGLSIDLDVKETMRIWGCATKTVLDEAMEERGWFCHRRDHKIDAEGWHFNFLGAGAEISPRVQSTSGYVEARILKLYGDRLKLSDADAQICLAKLHLYSGEFDGKLGPISKEAIRVFQRGWGLTETGKLDTKTQRTLAYVSASREIT